MDTTENSKAASGTVTDVMPSNTANVQSTSSDVRDMWRTGKVQELKASNPHQPNSAHDASTRSHLHNKLCWEGLTQHTHPHHLPCPIRDRSNKTKHNCLITTQRFLRP